MADVITHPSGQTADWTPTDEAIIGPEPPEPPRIDGTLLSLSAYATGPGR